MEADGSADDAADDDDEAGELEVAVVDVVADDSSSHVGRPSSTIAAMPMVAEKAGFCGDKALPLCILNKYNFRQSTKLIQYYSIPFFNKCPLNK